MDAADLTPAERAELRRIDRNKLRQDVEPHDAHALQSLIDKGLVAPSLHNELTREGLRVLQTDRFNEPR